MEQLGEENPKALLADGFEDAFIGICERFGQQPLAAYDYFKCIDILVSQGMTEEEAMEYFEFNTLGAWMGEGTPVFIRRTD
jgi:hypothetical protein